MSKSWPVILILTAAGLLCLYLLFWPKPQLPIEVANGTYANSCCGTITLRNGTMTFGNHELTYVIETDKGGAYILPRAYVGVEPPYGLQIERNRNRLKLRLDDEVHPESISILGSDNEYYFTR